MDGLGNRTSPFLATSAMMLATLGVQEDWGFSRVGSRGRTPISWIFILASVSAGDKKKRILVSDTAISLSNWGWLIYSTVSRVYTTSSIS